MKRVCILLIALMTTPYLYAQQTQATDASVRELLTITHAKSFLNSMFMQLDTSFEKSIRKSMPDESLNTRQRAVIKDMHKQLAKIYGSAFSWAQYRSTLITIYRNTFTESQVEAMIKFYKSAAGRAVIEKMPMVMRSSLRASQVRMREIMPRLRTLQQETVQRLKDAGQSK